MLCARRHLDNSISLEGWDFDFSSEHGRNKVDRNVTGNIETFSLKDLMRLDGDRHIKIPRGPIIRAMLTFIGETKSHAGFNAGRNVHGDRTLFVYALAALTCRAGFRDDTAGPFTLPAWSTDTKKSLLKPDLPGTFAARAGFDRRRRLRPRPLTVDTDFPTWDLELGLFAVDGFFKRDFKVVLEVITAFCPTAVAAASLTEKVFKDVVENVPKTSTPEVKSVKPSGPCCAPA